MNNNRLFNYGFIKKIKRNQLNKIHLIKRK